MGEGGEERGAEGEQGEVGKERSGEADIRTGSSTITRNWKTIVGLKVVDTIQYNTILS